MRHNTTIAGLSISTNFCHKINHKPLIHKDTSEEPLVSIYQGKDDNTYHVSIITRIPVGLHTPNTIHVDSGLFLDKEKTLFLSYNGVKKVFTSVLKNNDDPLLCRNFTIEYDYKPATIEFYDLYQIQFDYHFTNKDFQSVEAIIVKIKDEDPRTDRGTVTAVRTRGR